MYSETKAHVDQLGSEILKDHGYNAYWHSGERRGYSGVATFCKNEPLYVQEGLGIDKYDVEGRVLLTEHDDFYSTIYISKWAKDDIRLKYKLDFYDDLLPMINEQVESGNNVIVAGDWNTAHHPIDLARPKENINTSGFMPIEREKLDEYVEDGWVDTLGFFMMSRIVILGGPIEWVQEQGMLAGVLIILLIQTLQNCVKMQKFIKM